MGKGILFLGSCQKRHESSSSLEGNNYSCKTYTSSVTHRYVSHLYNLKMPLKILHSLYNRIKTLHHQEMNQLYKAIFKIVFWCGRGALPNEKQAPALNYHFTQEQIQIRIRQQESNVQ